MFGAVILDALLGLTVFVETLAAISLLQSLSEMPLREELDPILTFYKSSILPVAAAPAHLVSVSGWFMDAYVLSLPLCFLFFLRQANIAMAPYGDFLPVSSPHDNVTRSEARLDAVLPVIFCGLGAALTSLTLLPLLTPVAAIWLLYCKRRGTPSWFEVSRLYYVNLYLVMILTVLIVGFAR